MHEEYLQVELFKLKLFQEFIYHSRNTLEGFHSHFFHTNKDDYIIPQT